MLTAAASDTAELAAACQQLLSDVPGDITEEAVNRYYGGRTEVTAFRVSDAAISGNAPEALRLLRHSLATGTEPIRRCWVRSPMRNPQYCARAPRAHER